ncbi:ubiquitin carboxyl-terminal hydrolase 16/45 [Ochlerotatus camptorhynchus]|uniref:ubiquitin carboxyl-terminal hydrolase 16/45 n=1 Tax=Ochlerotatus camptorhynchus TaxID=644619 RepID=UPI0031CDED69
MVKKKCNEIRDDDSSTESNDDARLHPHSAPGDKCVHVKKAIDPTMVKKKLKLNGLEKHCPKCVEDKTLDLAAAGDGEVEGAMSYDMCLWLCLQCGTQLCGRYRNQHALAHYKTPRSEPHSVAMNTTEFKVWCYQCDYEVNPKLVPKLADCVEFVKREAEKAKDGPPAITNIEQKLLATVDDLRAVMGDAMPIPIASGSTVTSSTMGLASGQNRPKGTNSIAPLTTPNYRDLRLDIYRDPNAAIIDGLPRVRGLSNLGNTCFYNAVLQCLARTPFLLDVLKESATKGEKFQLPGGLLKHKDGSETELRPINSELDVWGSLTESLAYTLTELQSEGGVFSPSNLLRQLTAKWPQFAGAEQHDSHELLRHLLVSVAVEDLRRYQLVILISLGYSKNVNPQTVENSMKEKIKFYGAQAEDRIFRPEPVFRGFLVSTLTCQECYHVSSRHESFLDLSLPVSVEKPQPPIRRKGSPEPDYGFGASSSGATCKPLSSKERRRVKKANRAAVKKDKNLLNSNATAAGATGPETGTDSGAGGGADGESEADDDGMSDADVEDNLTDDSQPKKFGGAQIDQNGNQQSSVGPEKRDDTPENPNKEGVGDGNVVCELGLSAEGVAIMMEKMTLNSSGDQQQDEQDAKNLKTRRQRTYSHADWGSTLAPRYQCEENECSIQSCLNGFTVAELMTGSNKVCCLACTERINGKDGKSVNTNATKQFLISSPPAVLILHLKRFQVGPRGMLRKITKSVTFPFVLDIAPFCGSRVKKLPNVMPGQKKLLYSLYGIVEHSGTMHGGHYVAYVKVRPQLPRDDMRWEFLPKGSKAELDQKDEEALQLERELAKEQARNMTTAARDSDDALSSSSSLSSSRSSTGMTTSDGDEEGAVGYTPKAEILPDVDPPPGKWYYVSDSHVRETTEEQVLNAQAYLLFYERIF